jgi:catechol 2,3-dioxygenase-like lactoylglutathione lyase family enzyme
MSITRRTLLLATTATALGAGASLGAAQPKERVLGIGGVFFRSRDPKQLAAWYEEHLGILPVPTEYNQPVWQQTAGPTVFAPFATDTDYFNTPFMLNFRVRDLDAMVAQLKGAGIDVKVDPKVYPNGRFARLHDPDKNPIELWEPAGPKA